MRHFDAFERPLKLSLGIVIIFLVAEVIGGILSNSLALIGDAAHMLVDGLALGLSLFASMTARRPPTARKTYGFYRIEIVVALANGGLLSLIAFYILWEAYRRFIRPSEVRAPLMLVVAVLGLLANVAMIFLLRQNHEGLNLRAAFWHVVSDALSSVGVILGAVIILLTGWARADAIVAIPIGVVILWGALRLVYESVDILLEAVPRHINLDAVIAKVKAIPGLVDVHDTHIWTITSGVYALSAHLVLKDQSLSLSMAVLAAVNECLRRDFGIIHATLQLECDGCPSGFICGVNELRNNPEVH